MNTQIVVDVENIKLVPVVKWPLGDFPIELPGLDRYIEVGLIYDVSELRALVVASYPEIKRHVIPTAFDGGFCLMSGTSILVEPQCCSDMGTLDSWEKAAGLARYGSLIESRIWTRLYIGHPELVARRDEDFVLLGDDDPLASEPLPFDGGAVFRVKRDELQHAVSSVKEIVRGLEPLLSEALDGVVDDALRPAAVEWILHGTGDYVYQSNEKYPLAELPNTEAI
jgi:hypothetical protein